MKNLSNIDAVILCGGLGTRLRETIGEKQKVMAPVDGHPFLEMIINNLKTQGFKHVVLCTGYKSNDVKDYFAKNAKDIIFDFSEEKEPLGTGGALKNARQLVKSNPFFAMNGDCLCPVNYQYLLDFHLANSARASIVVSMAKEAKEFGKIVLDDKMRITKFIEKDKAAQENFVNAGTYCFNNDIFNLMPKESKFSIEYDFFPKLTNKDLYGYVIEEGFIDIGTPKSLAKAQKELKESKN